MKASLAEASDGIRVRLVAAVAVYVDNRGEDGHRYHEALKQQGVKSQRYGRL